MRCFIGIRGTRWPVCGGAFNNEAHNGGAKQILDQNFFCIIKQFYIVSLKFSKGYKGKKLGKQLQTKVLWFKFRRFFFAKGTSPLMAPEG